ncbi:TetR/AcrR family transcriptional regulator [Paenibacillus algorifonticola]|uniref:TetR/AcrR family transcriptional regulator n=1 Tax=Paenibacillus algorifonticola TaxID=684063 RepID=UPI003D29ED17
MNGFERRKQQKLEQIYSAAFQLFFSYGFQKVSVNEIADKAKVSPATIYNYFKTKEQLYFDMLMDWMNKQLEQYERILGSEVPFLEKTKEIMLCEAKNLKLLSEDSHQAAFSGQAEFINLMDQYNERKVVPFFKQFVAMGKQEGYIHSDISEEMMMLYFTMFKNELSRHWEASDQVGGNMLSLEQLVEFFFYGLSRQGQTP